MWLGAQTTEEDALSVVSLEPPPPRGRRWQPRELPPRKEAAHVQESPWLGRARRSRSDAARPAVERSQALRRPDPLGLVRARDREPERVEHAVRDAVRRLGVRVRKRVHVGRRPLAGGAVVRWPVALERLHLVLELLDERSGLLPGGRVPAGPRSLGARRVDDLQRVLET